MAVFQLIKKTFSNMAWLLVAFFVMIIGSSVHSAPSSPRNTASDTSDPIVRMWHEDESKIITCTHKNIYNLQ